MGVGTHHDLVERGGDVAAPGARELGHAEEGDLRRVRSSVYESRRSVRRPRARSRSTATITPFIPHAPPPAPETTGGAAPASTGNPARGPRAAPWSGPRGCGPAAPAGGGRRPSAPAPADVPIVWIVYVESKNLDQIHIRRRIMHTTHPAIAHHHHHLRLRQPKWHARTKSPVPK